MANTAPMWWMRGSGQTPPHAPIPPPPPPPPPLSMPECDCVRDEIPCVPPVQPAPPLSQMLGGLTDRLRHMDGETLLLLALIWLFYRENADRRLLLALAYIIL